jgi:hypothetical protein
VHFRAFGASSWRSSQTPRVRYGRVVTDRKVRNPCARRPSSLRPYLMAPTSHSTATQILTDLRLSLLNNLSDLESVHP